MKKNYTISMLGFNGMKMNLTILIIIVIIIMVLIALFSMPQNSSRLVDPIIHAVCDHIDSITIEPHSLIRLENNIVSKPVLIKKKDDIKNICVALNNAKPYRSIHPKSIWNSILRLSNSEKTHVCLVEKTHKNGILIDIYSWGEWGWHLGEFRSDSLGPLLEKIAKDSGEKGRP